MSLSRFTARVLAISALLPQPGDTDLITMAGDSVFDTHLDPLQFNADDSKDIPAIVVYTDEDTTQLLNTAGSGGPYRRRITMRIELTVSTFADFKAEDGTSVRALGFLSLDQELEAQLDLFEQQVRWALLGIAHRPATVAFQSWIVRIHSIDSIAARDAENNRLSSRRLMMSIEIPDDCPPLVAVDPPGCEPSGSGMTAQSPMQVPITPDMFPQAPWLATMFATMQTMPSYRMAINRLAGTGVPAIILPALKRLQITFGAGGTAQHPNTIPTSKDI